MSFAWPLRQEPFFDGTGTIGKPVPTDRPTAAGEITADFNGLTHYNRVVNSTIADVVLTFTGAVIEGAHSQQLIATIPDCGFTQTAPFPTGPGPVSQAIAFEAASSTADVPSVTYKSTDAAL